MAQRCGFMALGPGFKTVGASMAQPPFGARGGASANHSMIDFRTALWLIQGPTQ